MDKLAKVLLMKIELVYLGFVISKDGLKMYPKKVKVIIDWPSPKNKFEAISFQGLASFYRKLIMSFSRICAPIVETFKKNNQYFHWTAVSKRGFHILKKKVAEQPILTLPDVNKMF